MFFVCSNAVYILLRCCNCGLPVINKRICYVMLCYVNINVSPRWKVASLAKVGKVSGQRNVDQSIIIKMFHGQSTDDHNGGAEHPCLWIFVLKLCCSDGKFFIDEWHNTPTTVQWRQEHKPRCDINTTARVAYIREYAHTVCLRRVGH